MNVIFCGLLREPERFKASLRDMAQLQDEGVVEQVIWSTWRGAARCLPRVKVIESVAPKKNTGHIWHQMRSLEVGLDNSKATHVLKTRTDVYIDPDFIRSLKENCGDKVWIPWYQRLYPFYMADECFYGEHSEIEKLVNFCEDYDGKYRVKEGLSHVRRFAHAHAYGEMRAHIDGASTREEYMEHYYKVLRNKFYVHPGGVKFRWWSGKPVKRALTNGIQLDFCCDIKSIEE